MKKDYCFNFRIYGREGHRCALSFKPSCEWTDWDGHRFVLHANDELACGYQYADMDVYASDILSAIDLLRAQLEDGIGENYLFGKIYHCFFRYDEKIGVMEHVSRDITRCV